MLDYRAIIPRNLPPRQVDCPKHDVETGDPKAAPAPYITDSALTSAPLASSEGGAKGQVFPTETISKEKSNMGVAALAIGFGAALLLLSKR